MRDARQAFSKAIIRCVCVICQVVRQVIKYIVQPAHTHEQSSGMFVVVCMVDVVDVADTVGMVVLVGAIGVVGVVGMAITYVMYVV
jgi:hypothetical protein